MGEFQHLPKLQDKKKAQQQSVDILKKYFIYLGQMIKTRSLDNAI